MKIKAVAYTRVSTTMQVDTGHSLAAQSEAIRAYCNLYDIELVELYTDEGLSARTLERPGLTSALERLKLKEASMLIVYKLDRLTRSVADLGTLLDTHFKEGAFELASVVEKIDTTTPGGRLTLNILTSVAQWEREVISERISTAMQHMKREGKRTGYIPFSMKLAEDGVHLIRDDQEQSVLELIRTKRAEKMSLRKIATWLNEQEILNRGRAWNAVTINSKLKQKI
jgi:site-specific DNA recombinase